MTVTRISKEVEFDAGHRVPNHASKCASPHGHRYRVRLTVEGPVVDDASSAEDGMVTDFGVLKEALVDTIHDPFDHSMIVWCDDHKLRGALDFGGDAWKVAVVQCVPTAENLADLFCGLLQYRLALQPFRVVEVAVWETPTSCATVTP